MATASIYRPLQDGEIRILNIQPRNEGSPLVCSLIYDHVSAPASPFEALSYTWGDPNDREAITCNDTSVSVTKSLFGALQALRFPDRGRFLWIDAICINQKDVDEKNVQVQLMASIYQSAFQVIIWLGEEAEDTVPAMDLLAKIATGGKVDNAGDLERLTRNLILAGVPPTHHDPWKSLARFLARPWFSRVWVVQEAVLSRAVIVTCGSHQIGWEDLHIAAETIDKILCGAIVDSGHLRIMSLQRYQQRREEKDLGLLRLLLVERSQLATDDRDKVFALLGLATDVGKKDHGGEGARIHIAPDYRGDVKQVYTDLGRAIITGSESLSILTAAGLLSHPGVPHLPSWVPDWSRRESAKPLMTRQGESNYRACNGRPADYSISPDGLRLTVSGILCDRISSTGRPWNEGFEPLPVLLEWILLAQGEEFDPERLFAFRRTLSANRSLLGDGPPTEFERAAFFEWFRTMMKAVGKELTRDVFRDPEGLNVETETGNAHFRSLVYEACAGRCFFLTEKGGMGVGPATAAVGDGVVVVRGACVPLVLREVRGAEAGERGKGGKEAEKVVYVGDAYVDGLMYGEAYDETMLRDFELQ
ncbi:hypothetical protein MMC30_000304 [Trapelia coarctata]|nr:hypothetical protein [Trapelia coarctata]